MFAFKKNTLATSISLLLLLFASANDAVTKDSAIEDTAIEDTAIETVYVEGEQNKLTLEKQQALTPGGVTVLDSSELEARSVSNLNDMLRYVPGVWVASGSTGDSSFFSSRGSNLDATNYDGNGIKFLVDGLPVTAADGNNHNRAIDPLSTRYAVVARGSNALTFGASTLGGAINFISQTARDTDSQVFLNGGSHGQLQSRATFATVHDQFDALITLDTRQWDGFREQQHAQDRKGFYANAGWRFNDDASTRFYLTWLSNDQQLPGALSAAQFEDNPWQANASNATGNHQHNVETLRIAKKTLWERDNGSSITFGLSYEEQALYHPIVSSPFFSLLIDTDQQTTGLSLRYNFNAGDHDMLMGLNYGQTTVEGGNYSHAAGLREDLMTRVDNDADSLEFFLVDRWQLNTNWKLVYGVQAVSASREVRNTNTSTDSLYNPKGDFDSINPRAGVIYQLNENSEAFANISRLYEAPTNYELQDDANPDGTALDAMNGTVVEIGTRGENVLGAGRQWFWELALYYGQLEDEILSVEDPDAPGTSLVTNVDDTIHAGIEALIGASFALGEKGSASIDPMLNITFNEFSFDSDPVYGNNTLPVAPAYAIKGEILYRNASGLFAGPTFDIVDNRFADFANTYDVEGYRLIGFRAGYHAKSWEVFADARNLTDKEYVAIFSVRNQIPADPDMFPAILQPGEPRSIYLGFKLRF